VLEEPDLGYNNVSSLTEAMTAVKALIFCCWIPSLSTTTMSVQRLLLSQLLNCFAHLSRHIHQNGCRQQ